MAAGYSQPGKRNDHSGPYSKCFTPGSASSTDLTNIHPAARCAASGLFIIVVASGTSNTRLRFKDCAGNDIDTGSFDGTAGAHIDLSDFAATELTANTNCIVWAYWNPISGR